MKTTVEKIEKINQYGYTLNFGEVLEKTFANYKKIALIGGVTLILLTIISIVFSFGAVAVYNGVGSITDFAADMKMMNSSTSGIMISLISGVAASVVGAPLTAGLLQIAHNAEIYKEFSLSTAFEHYKGKYFKDIIIAGMIVNITIQLITLAFRELAIYNPDAELKLSVLGMLPVLLISMLTYLMTPLIIFGNLNATEAIKGSVVLVIKGFWTILGLIIVCFICAAFGFVALCIGIVFTLPLIYSLNYIIYRTAMGTGESDELEEIGIDADNY